TAGSLASAAPADVNASAPTASAADVNGPINSALIVQDGDNTLRWHQQGTLTGGDAVAGSNVVGLAGVGNADVFVRNNSTDSSSVSGDVRLDSTFNDVRVGNLAVGPQGPQGAVGPTGPQGPQGGRGATGFTGP